MEFRCYHCPDQAAPSGFFEFEADRPACPKCGRSGPQVVRLTPVHFLALDQQGPIQGGDGLRYKIACQPKRDFLATARGDDFSATPDPRAATCKSCMGVREWKEAAAAFQDVRLTPLFQDKEGNCC